MGFEFDDEFAAAAALPDGESRKRAIITAAQFAALPWRGVPCGYYTLVLTDGSRKRFRVRLERGKFAPGHRSLSIYRKLDVEEGEHREQIENEWETLALIGAPGLNIFKRWRGQWEGRWCEAMWKLATGQEAQGYALEIEARCWLTMRELADDDAKRTGLCKAWRKRFGIAG